MEFKHIAPNVTKPIFNDYLCYITSAMREGLNIQELTELIQGKIDECSSEGGGRVVLTRGMYTIKPIQLKDHVNLHLENGAFVRFSSNFDDYEIVKTSFEGLDTYRCVSPIHAENATNIAITGEGIIDGNGFAWRPVKKYKMTEIQWNELINSGGYVDEPSEIWWPTKNAYDAIDVFLESGLRFDTKEVAEQYREFARPNMVQLTGCKNVLLEGVTFQNSAAWNLHPILCENVIIENVTVRNPWYSQNGDGLDLESCKNVIVTKTTFDVGDDAICMKSGKDQDGRDRGVPSENIWVDQCTVYHGHGGFVVGSEMSGGIKNVYVSNCTFIGTDVGIRFKSCRGRGGVVEDVYIENVDMMNIVNEAIIFTTYYQDYNNKSSDALFDKDETTPEFKNVYIRNTKCEGSETPIMISGLPEQPIHDLTFENVCLTGQKDVVNMNSENIEFINCKVNGGII